MTRSQGSRMAEMMASLSQAVHYTAQRRRTCCHRSCRHESRTGYQELIESAEHGESSLPKQTAGYHSSGLTGSLGFVSGGESCAREGPGWHRACTRSSPRRSWDRSQALRFLYPPSKGTAASPSRPDCPA
ncbi:hypothetical protein PENSPDRAFT_58903 [Peniophora sp. CONT]|nr:hypothetical protein PENSPDRAFT_58903 [Peniophora sp. CONT]